MGNDVNGGGDTKSNQHAPHQSRSSQLDEARAYLNRPPFASWDHCGPHIEASSCCVEAYGKLVRSRHATKDCSHRLPPSFPVRRRGTFLWHISKIVNDILLLVVGERGVLGTLWHSSFQLDHDTSSKGQAVSPQRLSLPLIQALITKCGVT